MTRLPKGWTLRYLGIGVFASSKQYLVLLGGTPQFEISVDRQQKGACITIDKHLDYIYKRHNSASSASASFDKQDLHLADMVDSGDSA